MAINVKNLEGKELADDYVRKASDRGRWGLTWDVLKGNFGKTVLINILMVIFCLPAVSVIIIRTLYVNGLGGQYPFNTNTGVGYPAYTNVQGMTESIYLNADLLFYSIVLACSLIAAIGLAGGAYSIRKLFHTQGQFTLKGFFHGVKVCYLKTLLPVLLFMSLLYATILIGDWKDLVIARGGSSAGPITAYVFIIIATVLVGIYAAWLFAVGVSFRTNYAAIIKDAFLFLISSPVQTLFFAGFALIPVWLYLIGTVSSIFRIIIYILLNFIGISFILLVWLSFTQWIFDLHVTPGTRKAVEEANAKKSPKELAAEKEEEDKLTARELLAAGRSELIGKPILPISDEVAIAPLGTTYTRADVAKLSEGRQKLGAEVSAYEQEHINDPLYAEYNRLFAEREKALQSDDKKGKKKKRLSADNLLK